MIETLIWEIVKKRLNVPCFECEVISVDKDKDTCRLKPTEEDRAELLNVRLTATIETKETKVVIYPSEGSTVVVILLNDMVTQALIVAFSEIEEINIKCDKVVFNGGSLGGLIKLDYLYERLQAIETALNTHTHSVSGAVAALNPAAITPLTVKANLENTKIKH